jgi:hypothetical protein
MARLGLVANVHIDLPPIIQVTLFNGAVKTMNASAFIQEDWCEDYGFVLHDEGEIFSIKDAKELCYSWSEFEENVQVVLKPKPVVTVLMVKNRNENEFCLVYRLLSGVVLESNAITTSLPSRLTLGSFADTMITAYTFITPDAVNPLILGPLTNLYGWVQ